MATIEERPGFIAVPCGLQSGLRVQARTGVSASSAANLLFTRTPSEHYINSRDIINIYHQEIETGNILIDGPERQRLRNLAAKGGASTRRPSHAPDFRVVADAASPNPYCSANMTAPRSAEVVDLCVDDGEDAAKANPTLRQQKLKESVDQARQAAASPSLPSGRATRDRGRGCGGAESTDFHKRTLDLGEFAPLNATRLTEVDVSFKDRSCGVLETTRKSRLGTETSNVTKDFSDRAAPSKSGVAYESLGRKYLSTILRKGEVEGESPSAIFKLPSTYPTSPFPSSWKNDWDDFAGRSNVAVISQTKRVRDEYDTQKATTKKRKVDLSNGISRSISNSSASYPWSCQLSSESNSIQPASSPRKTATGREGDLQNDQKNYEEVVELIDDEDRSERTVQPEMGFLISEFREPSGQRSSSSLGRVDANAGSMLHRDGGTEFPTDRAQGDSDRMNLNGVSPYSNTAHIFEKRRADQTRNQRIDARDLPENESFNNDAIAVKSAAATFPLTIHDERSTPQLIYDPIMSKEPRTKPYHQAATNPEAVDTMLLLRTSAEVAKYYETEKGIPREIGTDGILNSAQQRLHGMAIGGKDPAAADVANYIEERPSESRSRFMDIRSIIETRQCSISPLNSVCTSTHDSSKEDFALQDAGLKFPWLKPLNADTAGTNLCLSQTLARTSKPSEGKSDLMLVIATMEPSASRSEQGSEAPQSSSEPVPSALNEYNSEFGSLDLPTFASVAEVTTLEGSPGQLDVNEPSTPSGTEANHTQQSDMSMSQKTFAADTTMADHSAFPCGADDTSKEVGGQIPLFASLTLSQQINRVLGERLDEYREDNTYWTRHWLKKARYSARSVENFTDQSHISDDCEFEQKTYSFKSWKPVSCRLRDPKDKCEPADSQAVITVEKKGASKHSTKATFILPVTSFEQHDGMPTYSHYVSIGTNFLAPNNRSMQHWPYFEDDFNYDEAESLLDQYNLDIRGRKEKLDRLQKAQSLAEYIGAVLQDLQISWHDVLRYFFEQHPIVGDDVDAQKALKNRKDACSEEFTREHHRSVTVLSSLPPSSLEALGKAAVLCQCFQEKTDLQLWHIARRHQFDWLPSTKIENTTNLYDSLTCRLCLRFNCPYHGEIEEYDDEDYAASESASGNPVAFDIVHPPEINQRTRISFPSTLQEAQAHSKPYAPLNRRNLHYWQGYRWKNDERGPFYPCHHPGITCEEEGCSCFENNLMCEKFCHCELGCARKFSGCGCATAKVKRGQRMMCFDDERCICFMMNRECDPDLCSSCGVCEVSDPINRYNESILKDKCRNASLQRGVPKRTLIGNSGIHGFGLYAGENIDMHEFVGEYKGEIITKEEGERRGAVYEHQKLSYLFTLNTTQEIDSTYFGNKIRFINHAGNNKNNLYPRIFFVGGVHRIALFAERPIRTGEELFFDYGPMFPGEQLGGTAKSAPRVCNSKTMRDAVDVEFEEDEHGIRRARKAPRTRSRHKKQVLKSRSEPVKHRRMAQQINPSKSRKTAAEPDESTQALDDAADMGDGILADRSAGARLSAYNISDELDDAMAVDAQGVADQGSEPTELEKDGDGNCERQAHVDQDVDGMLRPRRRRPRNRN